MDPLSPRRIGCSPARHLHWMVALGCLLPPLACAQQLRPYQTLIRSGQPAPGIPGATVGFLEPASIGQGGHIAVFGRVADNAQPTGNLAIWSGRPGGLELLARRGMAAPLADPGDVFDSFLANQLPVGSDGSVAFQATLNSIQGPVGVWAGTPGALVPAFIEGRQAPGFPDGASFDDLFFWKFSGAGVLALRGRTSGGGVAFGNSIGIWLGRAGELSLIAREDQPAPLGAGAVFANLSTARPSVNSLGEICFTAFASGSGINTTRDEVLLRASSPADLAKVLQEADPMPGQPGRVFDNLSATIARQRTNDAGEILFATQDRSQPQPRNTLFCLIDRHGTMTVLAEENSPAPDTTDTFGEDFFDQPLLGGRGHAAFDAQLAGVGGELDIDAIFAVLDRQLRLVARAGDPAPGFAEATTFATLDSPAVTDTGFVVFEATTSTGVRGIWGGRRGSLELVARAGDQLEVDGVIRTIDRLELARGSDSEPHGGGQDGYETVINDRGELVFWVSTVLEPTIGTVNAIIFVPALIDDGDGVACLLEQAFGSDCAEPDDGAEGLPRILISAGNAVFQFRRRPPGDGFEYAVETSPDGRGWQPLETIPTPSADQSGLPAGLTRVEVAVPLSTSPARMLMRVRVSRS